MEHALHYRKCPLLICSYMVNFQNQIKFFYIEYIPMVSVPCKYINMAHFLQQVCMEGQMKRQADKRSRGEQQR